MNILKKGLALVLTLGGFAAAYADAGVIQGYFRVQNEGNQNYVEVTGPFTAKPNLEDPQQSAGSIMYLEAEQQGNAYVIKSLRCQGIDVVGESINPEDYQSVMSDALSRGSSAVYGLMQEGLLHGYTSIARAAVGTVFWFVASYLDGYAGDLETPDGTSYTKEDFMNVTTNFNENVTANLDLGIRLIPVADKENTLQMYFDVPSLDIVSNWYQEEDNYTTFTAAMMAMRAYLDKYHINLEAFTTADVELFQSWNYDITKATGVTKDTEEGSQFAYTTSFPEIFKDPILLFNWIKWVGYMVLNPKETVSEQHNLAEMMENLGFSDIAGSLNNHYLTNMLINYLPRLHYNTRAYLINGKVVNGAWQNKDNQLDFANETELIYAAKEYGNWILVPVDNSSETGKFMVPLTQEWTDPESEETKNYAAVYYDFEVTAADENTTLNTLSDEESSMGYQYVTLVEQTGEIPAQTAMVVSSTSTEVQLNVGDGTYTITALDPSLFEKDETEEIPNGAVQVTDENEVSNTQHIRRKAVTVANYNFKGVLFPTESYRIDDYWNIDPSSTPVYGFFTTSKILSSEHLVFENTGGDLPANQAIYVYPNNEYSQDYVLINAPTIAVTVGETNTDNEEPDGDEPIKLAQAFGESNSTTGEGTTSIEGIISFPAPLEPGKDFTISIKSVNSENNWMTAPAVEGNGNPYESVLGAVNEGLWTQYQELGEGVAVDGFFTADEALSVTAGDGVEEAGMYNYDLHISVPCSGIYEMDINSVEGSEYPFTNSTGHKVKIYPNLQRYFGDEPGFNIAGYGFEKGSDIINIPLTASEGVTPIPAEEISNCMAYIPGTYFASSLYTDYAGVPATSSKEMKRKITNAKDGAYWTGVDLSEFKGSTEKQLTVNVEKNGAAASYIFVIKDTKDNIVTGVDAIGEEVSGEAVYYNLQGVRVSNPENGIFVKVQNGKATKVIL